jgi:hypothetical protein
MLDTLSEDIRHALEFAGKSGSPSTFCRTTPGTTVLDGSRRLTHPTPVTAASRSSSTRSSRIRGPRRTERRYKERRGSCVFQRGAPGDGRAPVSPISTDPHHPRVGKLRYIPIDEPHRCSAREQRTFVWDHADLGKVRRRTVRPRAE